MKKPLSIQKMLLISAVFLLLDAGFLWLRISRGGNWFTPTTAKFLMKDIFLVIAWVLFFLQKKKNK